MSLTEPKYYVQLIFAHKKIFIYYASFPIYMSKKDDENLNALLEETKNQFNYSSNLFDSLESKSNTIIVALSIILVVTLNSYFLEKLESINLFFNIIYYIGIIFLISSFVVLLNLRKRKFKLISIEPLKNEYIKNPKKDFRKMIIGRYVPIINENFKHYYSKEKELRFALKLLKIGSSIMIIIILHIFIFIHI